MKIVHFIHSFPPETIGGVEYYVRSLVKELSSRGHENIIISGSKNNEKTKEEIDSAILYRIGLKANERVGEYQTYNPIVEIHVRELLSELKPDIVHVHHWHQLTNNLVSICHQMKIPAVVFLHDLWTTSPNINRVDNHGNFCDATKSPEECIGKPDMDLTSWKQQVQIELSLAQHITTPSNALIEFLQKCIHLPEQTDITPHPYGIFEPIEPPQLDRDRFPDAPLKIGYWGALVPHKGVRHLLRAFGNLYEDGYQNMELHIWGSGPYGWYLEELYSLADQLPITFYGHFEKEDVKQIDVDLAVFPMVCFESYSIVLDEAYQKKIPVIATARGALKDRVRTGGFLVEPGSTSELAETLKRILDNPKLLNEHRQNIPEPPAPSFAEQVGKMEGIYQKAIKTPLKEYKFDVNPSLNLFAEALRKINDLNEEKRKLEKRVEDLTNYLEPIRVELEAIKRTTDWKILQFLHRWRNKIRSKIPNKDMLKRILTKDRNIGQTIAHEKNLKIWHKDLGKIEITNTPLHIFLEVTRRCNIRCITCQHHFYKRDKEYFKQMMEYWVFEKIQHLLPNATYFHPFGYGEPMLNQHLIQMLELANRAGCNTGYITNGTLLNEKNIEQLIDMKLNILRFSIDGASKETFERIREGAKYDKVMGNMRLLRDMKRQKKSGFPSMGMETVLMTLNIAELPRIVSLAKELGIEFMYWENMVVNYPEMEAWKLSNLDRQFVRRILERSLKMAQDAKITVMMNHLIEKYLHSDSTDQEEVKTFDVDSIQGLACREPWKTIFVTYDGLVRPCCNSSTTLGNLADQSIEEIWNGETYREFRRSIVNRNFDKYCKQCIEGGRVPE